MRGFTLIELIVVIALIALILGIALPTVATLGAQRDFASAWNLTSAQLTAAKVHAIDTGDTSAIYWAPHPKTHRVHCAMFAYDDGVMRSVDTHDIQRMPRGLAVMRLTGKYFDNGGFRDVGGTGNLLKAASTVIGFQASGTVCRQPDMGEYRFAADDPTVDTLWPTPSPQVGEVAVGIVDLGTALSAKTSRRDDILSASLQLRALNRYTGQLYD